MSSREFERRTRGREFRIAAEFILRIQDSSRRVPSPASIAGTHSTNTEPPGQASAAHERTRAGARLLLPLPRGRAEHHVAPTARGQCGTGLCRGRSHRVESRAHHVLPARDGPSRVRPEARGGGGALCGGIRDRLWTKDMITIYELNAGTAAPAVAATVAWPAARSAQQQARASASSKMTRVHSSRWRHERRSVGHVDGSRFVRHVASSPPPSSPGAIRAVSVRSRRDLRLFGGEQTVGAHNDGVARERRRRGVPVVLAWWCGCFVVIGKAWAAHE